MINALTYSVIILSSMSATGQVAQINVEDGVGCSARVMFFDDTKVLNPDTQTVSPDTSCQNLVMNMHMKEYANVADLLRNEKPIGIGYVPGRGYFTNTSRESVGRNDLN